MDIEELAQRSADELEIRNVIAKLAMYADQHTDLDAYIDLYTDEVEWIYNRDGGEGVPTSIRGKEAMRDAALARRTGGVGLGSRKFHVVPMTSVTLDGDKASSESVMTFYDVGSGQPAVATMTFYHDNFVRTPDGWKLSRREILPV